MLVVSLLGIGGMIYLKQAGDHENARRTAAALAEAQQRAASDAALQQSLLEEYGGESHDAHQQALVAKVMRAITTRSDAKTHQPPLKAHLLAEPNRINLFALPTGDIYLTTALLNRMQTEGQLAAALAHGAAHVLSGERLAAVMVGSAGQTELAYDTAIEPKADIATLALMAQAGYHPNAYISMFTVLLAAYQTHAEVAFFITHPNAADRLQQIYQAIQAQFPQGIPKELSQ